MVDLGGSTAVIDWGACAQVEVNPQKLSGTPILKGTRMPAQAIFQNYTSGLPAEEIAEVFQLPTEDVRLLLDYAVRQNSPLRP